MRKCVLPTALILAACGSAFADPILDGVRDAGYSTLAVQNTQTNFGTANIGMVDYANGSALANISYQIAGGNLYLHVAGNLESNFNKLEFFFDNGTGGQNVLRADNADVDFNGLNRMSGMTFDTGFSPTHYFTTSGGYNMEANAYRMFASSASLLPGGGGAGGYLGSTNGLGAALSGGTNTLGVSFAIDNSWTDSSGGTGLLSGAALTAATACDTGFELCIPLASLGNPGTLRLAVMVNGGGHDFMSNQVLGGIGGGANLGDPHNINFNNIPGEQFVTIQIPAPGAAALAGLGLLAAGRRRR